jgi:hypothetical protein
MGPVDRCEASGYRADGGPDVMYYFTMSRFGVQYQISCSIEVSGIQHNMPVHSELSPPQRAQAHPL